MAHTRPDAAACRASLGAAGDRHGRAGGQDQRRIEAGRPGSAPDGRRRQPAGCRGRSRSAARRRQRGGCACGGADCARPGRTAILRHGRRRLPRLVRRQDRRNDHIRWPGNRTRSGHAGSLPRRRRQAARILRRGGRRPLGWRSRRAPASRNHPPALRHATLAVAFRAGDPARRSGLRHLPSPCSARRRRGRKAQRRPRFALLFLRAGRIAIARRAHLAQSGLCRDA